MIDDFIKETRENLSKLESDLIDLEKDPENQELLNGSTP